MKQIVSNYSYSPTTNVVTLTGVNIEQDQLLLVVAPQVGRTMYNFASGVTGVVSSGVNTRVTLNASTAGLTTTSPLVIFYDDHVPATSVTGTVALDPASLIALENVTVTVGAAVSISNFPSTQTIAGTVTANLPALNWNTVKITSGDGLFNGIYKKGSNGYVNAEGGGTPEYLPIDGFFQGGTIPKLTRGTHPGGFLPFTGTRWYFTSDGDVLFYSTTTASDLRVIADWTDSGGPEADVQITPYSVEPVAIPGGVGIAYSGSTESPSLVTNSNPFPVKVQNSVTIGSLPAIFGTVTARLQDASGNNLTSTSIGGVQRLNVSLASAATPGGSLPTFVNVYGGSDSGTVRALAVDSSGRTVVTVSNFPATQAVSLASTTVTVSALPSGALTTRFGSVTTANLSQITTAVTNTSRKYLLAQNISSGTVTIGIGFSPTTTQGIQLTAGAGLTFDAFCPTGAVYWLGAVTGAAWTILEG